MYIYLMLVLQIILRELDRYIIDKGHMIVHFQRVYSSQQGQLSAKPRVRLPVFRSRSKNKNVDNSLLCQESIMRL